MKHHSRLLLLSLLLCGGGLRAQTLAPCVVVEQTDGTRTDFLLSSEPRITYAADEVTLTATDATLRLPVEEVKKVYLSETLNVGTNISSHKVKQPRVQFISDKILLSGLPAGGRVAVYDVDGRMLLSDTADGDGTLSLASLPQGLLIIKTNNHSFKLIRK